MSTSPVIRKRKRGRKGTHPLLVHFAGRGRAGVINDCKRPDAGASKVDLIEFHREELRNRRARQLARKPNSRQPTSFSIAQENRHGGAHLHKREIDRRARQAAP
jgi:hypothetical protein